MSRCPYAISVDLDSISHYFRIFSLTPDWTRTERNVVYRFAIPRFLRLFAEFDIKATFFCVGEDLVGSENAALIREMVAAGHEIGNHTWSHDYSFSLLPEDSKRREIDQGTERIVQVAGQRPLGFRAPGYHIDSTVLSLLLSAGYGYDSSVFPCIPYYGLKAAVIQAFRLVGRPSASIVGDPRVLLAPRDPYFPAGRMFWQRSGRSDGLLEVPITVVPWLQAPLIGGVISLLGERFIEAAVELCRRGRRFINIELHGVDLLGLAEDPIEPALSRQRDLTLPVARKTALFRHLLTGLGRFGQSIRLDHLPSVNRQGR